jgi:L-alanine-DL-glutamate epimerase-like enolase superfamily enzyme
MKITKLETLRLGEFANLVWLRVHTDQGVVGVGETSYAAQSVDRGRELEQGRAVRRRRAGAVAARPAR